MKVKNMKKMFFALGAVTATAATAPVAIRVK